MTHSTFSDTDMIAVPRGLLAAASHCVRAYAPESKTYAALSALSLVVVDEPRTVGGILLSEHQSSGYGGWHPGDDA